MIEPSTSLSSAGQPASDGARATIATPQAGAATATADEDAAVAGSVDAAARHRLAEAAYLARTAGRRTDHPAALGALAAVAARIAALLASRSSSGAIRRGDGDGAPTDAGRGI